MKLISAFIEQMRVYQWVKNLLIFAPVLLAHSFGNTDRIFTTVLAFIAMCLLASGVYAINDVADVKHDVLHPRKRLRPIPSGRISRFSALILASILIGASAGIAFSIHTNFVLILALYGIVSTAYTFGIKRIVIADVLTLAGLFTLRVGIGSVASGIEVSTWLLGFCLFIFTSLAFLKRYIEMKSSIASESGKAFGRGYGISDVPFILVAGVCTAYIAILVFALYLTSENVQKLYQHPAILWCAVPLLLYWVTKMWFFASRGTMHDDPIVHALTDWTSYLIGILLVVVLWIATI